MPDPSREAVVEAILVEITRLEAENAEQDATIVKVRELHKPTASDQFFTPYCDVCYNDSGTDAADWPCPTALVVYTLDEIKERTT